MNEPSAATADPKGGEGPAADGKFPGRSTAYVVTWIAYASYYLGRKGFSVVKKRLEAEFGASVLVYFKVGYLSVGVETAYLTAYALGQYASGVLGDRVGVRRLVGYGMLASALACAAFGAGSASAVFFAAFLVNGFAQSTGWPGTIKAMAEWTTPETRGAVMGVWATCYQVGGLVATAFAAWLLGHYGWRSAFFAPALCIAGVGVLVLLKLRRGPAAAARPPGAAPSPGGDDDAALRREAQRRVLRSPLLWCYGVSYFSLKLIRYSLLFWLPYYLTTVLGYAEDRAGYFSTSFEIGGVLGTIVIGYLSDKLRSVPRSVIASLSCLGLAGALLLYGRVGSQGEVANFAAMALVGFLLFGPDTLVSGTAAQDVGGPHAAAIAAGAINGIGSLGAVLQESVTRGVSDRWGWDALFRVFLWLSIGSAVLLVPTFRMRRAVA
jgi:sugar phosphate permease